MLGIFRREFDCSIPLDYVCAFLVARHESGYGVVTSRRSPMELRKIEALLTPKGRALATKLAPLFDLRHPPGKE
jgi:hypothetical protein